MKRRRRRWEPGVARTEAWPAGPTERTIPRRVSAMSHRLAISQEPGPYFCSLQKSAKNKGKE